MFLHPQTIVLLLLRQWTDLNVRLRQTINICTRQRGIFVNLVLKHPWDLRLMLFIEPFPALCSWELLSKVFVKQTVASLPTLTVNILIAGWIDFSSSLWDEMNEVGQHIHWQHKTWENTRLRTGTSWLTWRVLSFLLLIIDRVGILLRDPLEFAQYSIVRHRRSLVNIDSVNSDITRAHSSSDRNFLTLWWMWGTMYIYNR